MADLLLEMRAREALPWYDLIESYGRLRNVPSGCNTGAMDFAIWQVTIDSIAIATVVADAPRSFTHAGMIPTQRKRGVLGAGTDMHSR